MGMQGITAATHRLKLGNMSNGANLAFTREIFYEVNGYQGIEHLASGDDYLLMMKIAKKPGSKIAYLKSKHAIVTTLPQPDWQSFFRQRIRWASKSGKYNDVRMTLVLAMVYLYHLCFPVLAVGGFWHSSLWWLALAMLGSKIIAEYLFMRPVTAFFNKKWARPYLPFVHPLHIVYIIVAGFLGMVGKYEWKGRKVK
jgi:cellulose synthase/poly-beta-1,6-N-acetylglucosamine synthase-like glycosyltransferase